MNLRAWMSRLERLLRDRHDRRQDVDLRAVAARAGFLPGGPPPRLPADDVEGRAFRDLLIAMHESVAPVAFPRDWEDGNCGLAKEEE